MCSATDDPTQHDNNGYGYLGDGASGRTGDPDDCDHEPNDAGTACRHCGLTAEPGTISAEALALIAAYVTADHTGHRARYTVALTQPGINRRRAIARQHLTDDLLATMAARSGLVADADALPLNACRPAAMDAIQTGRPGNDLGLYARRAEARQRQREAIDVWAKAERSRPADDDGWTLADRRELDAAHDAHTERELLAGLADADGQRWDGWPAIYTEGAIERPDLLNA